MNRVLGFKDPVLCDSFVCDSMGYSIQDVPYIPLAEKLGVGSSDTAHANMIYLNQPDQAGVKFRMTHRVQKLAAYTEPKDACSACYGSLIYALDRLNDAGYLRRGLPSVAIGQGYQNIPEGCAKIGVGRCTKCCEKSLAGCPPKAADIVEFLKDNWN